MITVNLERPIQYNQDGGGKVEIVAFDVRPPFWREEKKLRETGKDRTIDFDALMLTLAEPIGCDLPVSDEMVGRLSVWDQRKLERVLKGFFSHPDDLEPELRKMYGLSEK